MPIHAARLALTRSVTQKAVDPSMGPALRVRALRHARRPRALTRGRPGAPGRPGTGRSRRTARRKALSPASPRSCTKPSPRRTSPRPTKAPTQPLERCVNALAARCPHHGACPSASVSHSPLSLSHSPLQRVRDTRQIHSSGAGATLAPLAPSSLPLVTCLAADASHTHRPTRALHLHPGSSWGCEGHFTSNVPNPAQEPWQGRRAFF